MFFVIEFFCIIASYKFFNNDWILENVSVAYWARGGGLQFYNLRIIAKCRHFINVYIWILFCEIVLKQINHNFKLYYMCIKFNFTTWITSKLRKRMLYLFGTNQQIIQIFNFFYLKKIRNR